MNADLDRPDVLATERNSKRRLFAALLLIAIIASFAALPYLIEILAATGHVATFWELGPSVVTERAFYSAIAIWIGVTLGPSLGLDAPLVREWTTGRKPSIGIGHMIISSIVCGTCVAVIVGVGSAWLEPTLMPAWPDSARRAEEVAEHMAAWKVILASCSAGAIEELMFRFGLMTLFVWMGAKICRRHPGASAFWIANLLAAILFGLIHLTNVVQLGIAITAGTVLYMTLVNGVAGMAFGWMYWRLGLEAAVLSHIIADIVLKVVLPEIPLFRVK